jgi:hypothetical protein
MIDEFFGFVEEGVNRGWARINADKMGGTFNIRLGGGLHCRPLCNHRQDIPAVAPISPIPKVCHLHNFYLRNLLAETKAITL